MISQTLESLNTLTANVTRVRSISATRTLGVFRDVVLEDVGLEIVVY